MINSCASELQTVVNEPYNTANLDVCIIIIHMILPIHFFSDNYFINIKDFKTIRILLQVGTTITGKLMNCFLKYFPYANQTGLI